MSLNIKYKEELTFIQREHAQAFLDVEEALGSNAIRTVNKGLRAFLFYRNLNSLKDKKTKIKNRVIKTAIIKDKTRKRNVI